MKDNRFIELLNLYVDQQLSPTEASDLEREIADNPERRHTYIQYCRMQKACVQIFEQEQLHAPSPRLARALADADRKMGEFPQQSNAWRRGLYAVGVLAAAACFAFVLIRRSAPKFDEAPVVAREVISHQAADLPTFQSTMLVADSHQEISKVHSAFYSVLMSRNPSPKNGRDVTDQTAEGTPLTASFDWMQQVELTPLQKLSSPSALFDSRAISRDGLKVFRPAAQGANELSAFEFQR